MARRLPEPAFAALLLAPAALLLGLVVVVPLGRLLYLSLHELQLTRPNAGLPFVGLRNFGDAWDDPRFWGALRNTLVCHRRHRAGGRAGGPGPGAARRPAAPLALAGPPRPAAALGAAAGVLGPDLRLVLRHASTAS